MSYVNVYPAVGGDGASGSSYLLLAYGEGPSPFDVTQAVVTKTFSVAWVYAGEAAPYILGSCCLECSWTSTAQGGNMSTGADVAFGSSGPRGDRYCTLKARVKVNNKDRFKFLRFEVTDGTNSASSSDVLGSLTNGQWKTISSGSIDLNNFVDSLRFALTARGTDDPDKVGSTEFYIEHITVEFTSS